MKARKSGRIEFSDALGLGMPKASFSMFEESRREDGLHDGRHVVFLAASMYNQEESRRLRDLLRYVSGTQKEGLHGPCAEHIQQGRRPQRR